MQHSGVVHLLNPFEIKVHNHLSGTLLGHWQWKEKLEILPLILAKHSFSGSILNFELFDLNLLLWKWSLVTIIQAERCDNLGRCFWEVQHKFFAIYCDTTPRFEWLEAEFGEPSTPKDKAILLDLKNMFTLVTWVEWKVIWRWYSLDSWTVWMHLGKGSLELCLTSQLLTGHVGRRGRLAAVFGSRASWFWLMVGLRMFDFTVQGPDFYSFYSNEQRTPSTEHSTTKMYQYRILPCIMHTVCMYHRIIPKAIVQNNCCHDIAWFRPTLNKLYNKSIRSYIYCNHTSRWSQQLRKGQ